MQETDFGGVLIPLLVALAATIPGILGYINTRRKTPAEAADIITGAAGRMVERLQEQIDALESKQTSMAADLQNTREELSQTERKLSAAQAEIVVLRAELVRVIEEKKSLESFAESCKTTIEALADALKRNSIHPEGLTAHPGQDAVVAKD